MGFALKKVSEAKLDELDEKNVLDDVDKDALLTITKNVGEVISKNKSSRGR